jgi:hypothetical protein
MERRAIFLALALTLPLALYGVPYAYAATTSSTYEVFASNAPNTNTVDVHCNSGDYATGGGGRGGSGPLQSTHPEKFDGTSYSDPGTGQPNAWGAWVFSSPTGAQVFVWVVCQTPITVAGIGVPQFGSLYVAIALGAVAYFLLAKRYATGKSRGLPTLHNLEG